MANLMPSDIVDEVRQVLSRAIDANRYGRSYLTAYQILDRLPAPIRNRLIAERTAGGRGAGVSYAAPSVVSDAAETLPDIEIMAVESGGITIQVAGQGIAPGASAVGLYRLTHSASERSA